MIDESTGYLNDLLKILENVNFKGTNFKMPHSIVSVAIYNQTGNTIRPLVDTVSSRTHLIQIGWRKWG